MHRQNPKKARAYLAILPKWIFSLDSSISALFLAGAFFAYDIYVDAIEAEIDTHFYLELLVFIIILVHLGSETRKLFRLSTELDQEKTKTANLSGRLQHYISDQFQQWHFSGSETDIAWLMLKGYSFKEIAVYRHVKEKTVRQQASIIYTKSNNKNRNEFNSFFYEELIEGVVP